MITGVQVEMTFEKTWNLASGGFRPPKVQDRVAHHRDSYRGVHP